MAANGACRLPYRGASLEQFLHWTTFRLSLAGGFGRRHLE